MASRDQQLPGGPAARRPSWVARARARLRARREHCVDLSASVAEVLDLFEEHFYVGDITPDGRYVAVAASTRLERLFGAPVPPGAEPGALWESMIHADDWAEYMRFNRSLLSGQDADATYRVAGLDGVMRTFRDRARPVRGADGGVRVHGILTDITVSAEADARAAEAGERFTSLLDVVGEHVYLAIAHPDGSIEELFQGPGADRLLGGAEPDPEMVNWDNAVHPDDREAYTAFNLELGAGREADVEYRLRGADGITRWVHDRAATRRRPDGTVEISGIVSDVTERRRLEENVRRTHQAAELRARTDELTGTYNRRHFTELVTAEDAFDATALLLLDADHFKQVNDVHGHAAGDAVLVELARRLTRELAPDELLARWGGEEFALLLRRVDSDDELRRRAERLCETVRATPMLCAGTTIRLTVSIGAARHGDGPVALDAWIESADHALYAAKGRGRDRSCLATEVRSERTRPFDPESLVLARAIAFATALRADETEVHSQQVADLAGLVAEQLDLPAGMVARCCLAGWLHDVGKAAIPDAILDKPGALTDEEWAVMRTHPVHSEAIVLRIPALRESGPAVRHHHERFDGSGYPDGLAGAEIPIEARIVAAADAYCAMTADRVYSAARTPAEAAAELRRSAGTHLDPDVVRGLLAVIGEAARHAA